MLRAIQEDRWACLHIWQEARAAATPSAEACIAEAGRAAGVSFPGNTQYKLSFTLSLVQVLASPLLQLFTTRSHMLSPF